MSSQTSVRTAHPLEPIGAATPLDRNIRQRANAAVLVIALVTLGGIGVIPRVARAAHAPARLTVWPMSPSVSGVGGVGKAGALEEAAAQNGAAAPLLALAMIAALALVTRRSIRFVSARHTAGVAHGVSASRERAVVNGAACAIVGIDVDGHVFEWNSAAAAIFGVASDEAFGSEFVERFVTETEQRQRRADIASALRGRTVRDIEWKLVDVEGIRRRVVWSLTPLVLENGVVGGVIATGFDVTNVQLTEGAAPEERARLCDAIEALDAGFVMYDADERLVAYNERFIALGPPDSGAIPLGITLEQLLRRWLARGRTLPRGVEAEEWVARMLEAHRNPTAFEARIEMRDMRVSITRTRDDGRVVLFTDITPLKAIQASLMTARDAANAANRAKSGFLARMSHELRTPLNSIIGFTKLVQKNRTGRIAENDLQYLERVERNGVHLLSLINDLLDLSKIEAGKLHVELTPVDLAMLVRETIAQMEVGIRKEHVALVAELPATLRSIETDEGKLRQVVINLVANAVKFTHEGRVTVLVEATPDGTPLALEVRDTGIGIRADRLDAIFQPFEQGDEHVAHLYGGTGLGLNISRSLCELLGATLSVRSAEGVGSTFRVTFAPRRSLDTPTSIPVVIRAA